MSSGDQPSVIAGGASSFNQFRLTTFVDSNPKPKASSPGPRITPADAVAVERASTLTENGSAISKSHTLESFSERLQASPPGPDYTSSTTLALVAPIGEAASNSHNGFGVLDLTPAPAPREGKLGPHRDGRVRNPIPRKLKGKTNERSGNFAVMHMDMSGSGGHDIPRGEAAKRTSENTAEAARNASTAGYISMKRRRLEAARSLEEEAGKTGGQLFPSAPQQEVAPRDRMLTAEETKYEQARLLTLLRSINPLTVVDQICKALAFFGGIPGAPPPEDENFPDSAEANGSGLLFVGWLSEIFPELNRKPWKSAALKPVPESIRVKRPRGRPKGSKASKVRKDKGIKKGPKYPGKDDKPGLHASPLAHLRPATSQLDPENEDEEDEDWIDVTGVDGDLIDGNQRLDASEESTAGQAGSLGTAVDLNHGGMNSSHYYLPATANMGKRRPGRPKGSRNRPRDEIELNLDGGVTTSERQNHSVSESNATKYKGSRPLVAGSESQNTIEIGSLPAKRQRMQVTTSAESIRPSTVNMPGLSAEEQAVLEAFRSARAAQAAISPAKRTRAPRKSVAHKETPVPRPIPMATPTPISTSTQALNSTFEATVVPAVVAAAPTPEIPGQKSPVREAAPILPPPKRQRKPKDPNAALPAKKVTMPDTVESAHSSSIISQSSPVLSEPPIPSRPAQGLEAHYEHFATLQQQQQQREQQKKQRETERQQQIQARLDQSSVNRSSPLQTSSSMQSTSPFYTQPRQVPSPYSTQYPSHQTSNPYRSSLSTTDSFPSVNQPLSNFSPRQQQPHSPFNHFQESNFIDPLESVTNGTSNTNAYGTGVSRSTSTSGYGPGAQIGGFDSLTDNDIRDRLLRGIGRR